MDRSKKYGLQLRAPPTQKNPTKPPITNVKPVVFNDDDDDNVEREILRQAHKKKSHKDVEEQHKKALEEDPSVFDYDGVYDKMKEDQVRPLQLDRKDRQSRYIAVIKEKAKQREREQEIIYERKLAKERSKDEHMFADKDKFVTSAYKRKLAEQEKWKEEERLRELREQKEDVTKKTDISDFYFNLAKNIAFGANDADRKPKKQLEQGVPHSPKEVSPRAVDTSPESSTPLKVSQEQIAQSPSKQTSDIAHAKPVSETPKEDQNAGAPLASDQPKPDHHKKNEDAVAAAKARFLARKKSKVQ